MKQLDTEKPGAHMRTPDALPGPPGGSRRIGAGIALVLLTIVVLLGIGGTPLEALVFGTGALALALVFAKGERESVARALEFGRQFAGKDDATGLPSPDYAEHFVASEFAAAQRGRPVTVVLFGFDRFDAFTASHGAAAADHAVREFGRILKRLTRKMNHSARYGWRVDAFLSVLSESNRDAATVYVHRVQEAVAEAGSIVPMPVLSVGMAEFQPDFATPEDFVEAAERALAEARADGGRCLRYWRGRLSQEDAAPLASAPGCAREQPGTLRYGARQLERGHANGRRDPVLTLRPVQYNMNGHDPL
jgi:diguanylate cyclase (GGDEF)-like protein